MIRAICVSIMLSQAGNMVATEYAIDRVSQNNIDKHDKKFRKQEQLNWVVNNGVKVFVLYVVAKSMYKTAFPERKPIDLKVDDARVADICVDDERFSVLADAASAAINKKVPLPPQPWRFKWCWTRFNEAISMYGLYAMGQGMVNAAAGNVQMQTQAGLPATKLQTFVAQKTQLPQLLQEFALLHDNLDAALKMQNYALDTYKQTAKQLCMRMVQRAEKIAGYMQYLQAKQFTKLAKYKRSDAQLYRQAVVRAMNDFVASAETVLQTSETAQQAQQNMLQVVNEFTQNFFGAIQQFVQLENQTTE